MPNSALRVRSSSWSSVRNDIESFWLPFTANRAFKARPRLIARAKNMHYYTSEDRAVLDATAGLWCCNAGHSRDPIVAAIQAQAAELDFAPPFQFAHPIAFETASRLSALAPGDLNHVFFCNSGSEAADTALKIALAYYSAIGQGSRQRLIGRERGYHGVGFGGISVGGITNNRKFFGSLLSGVDHLPATYDREHQAFSRGEPDWGAHKADELERIVALHDASTIAAVIVEPMAGSTGVLPPPKGYLQRLRAICDKYRILLIFDEVITAFGRLGYAFAAERYGVIPDMITFAKAVTSGSVPMGGVIVRDTSTMPSCRVPITRSNCFTATPIRRIRSLVPRRLQRWIFIATSACLSANGLEMCGQMRSTCCRTRQMSSMSAQSALSVRSSSRHPDGAGVRGFEVMERLFHEEGMMARISADTIAISPPLIVSEAEIGEIVEKLSRVLKKVA